MKTAEEVARKKAEQFQYYEWYKTYLDGKHQIYWGDLFGHIAQALTAFAEERVKAAGWDVQKMTECLHLEVEIEDTIRRKARAEALEEAAKLVDKPVHEHLVSRIPGYVLAERIRALKDKP